MKKLLIVVDYQNDFVDGALGFEGANQFHDALVLKIEEYLSQGNDVVFTRDTHYDNYLETQEGENLPVVHCIKGTKGWEIYGDVNQYAETIFDKEAFGSLELANYLVDKDYEEIEIAGLVSNICVISTAVLAKSALPEALIIVDENFTDSYDKELHTKTLDVLEGFQVKIIRK